MRFEATLRYSQGAIHPAAQPLPVKAYSFYEYSLEGPCLAIDFEDGTSYILRNAVVASVSNETNAPAVLKISGFHVEGETAYFQDVLLRAVDEPAQVEAPSEPLPGI